MIDLGMAHILLIALVSITAAYHTSFASGGGSDSADGWNFETPRDEIAAEHFTDEQVLFDGKATLALAGNGQGSVHGKWVRTKPVEPKAWYLFETHFLYDGVAEPLRCVLARILWFDENSKQIGRAEYPRTLRDKTADGWGVIRQVYQIPDGVTQAKLELVYRWDGDGKVHFGGVRFEPTEAPKPRLVRLGTVHHMPKGTKSARKNLEQFAKLIARAAAKGADIVCLGEAITTVGTGTPYVQSAQPIPGPATDFLGQVAKKHKLYIVASIFERVGPTVYNTAVLLDRDGELAGKYRKLCIPREGIDAGITPGDSVDAFDTDFGRVGMMICWDNEFPEVARALAMKGAEVIFMPIWGGNETLTQARAVENQVYVVRSCYGAKSTIYDQGGELIGEATDADPVAVVEVDLSAQRLFPWLGDLKNRIPREMPPRSAIGPPGK